jgi:hypothetical protein
MCSRRTTGKPLCEFEPLPETSQNGPRQDDRDEGVWAEGLTTKKARHAAPAAHWG